MSPEENERFVECGREVTIAIEKTINEYLPTLSDKHGLSTDDARYAVGQGLLAATLNHYVTQDEEAWEVTLPDEDRRYLFLYVRALIRGVVMRRSGP